jgi:hypothetical protein
MAQKKFNQYTLIILKMPNRMKIIATLLLNIAFSFFTFSQCIIGDCVKGYGEKIYEDSAIFKGEFENGKKVSGIYFYKSGDIYKGAFKDNLRNGIAEYNYKNGDVFNGVFENDEKKFGVYNYSNGDKFSGAFKNNLPNGYGIFYKHSGKTIEGEWKNGHVIWQNDNLIDTTNTKDDKLANEKGFVTPRFFCVVVGISDYFGTNMDLSYADDDAIHITNYLKKAFVNEIRNGKLIQLINSQATKLNIENALKSVFSQATENDFILFYFSGHGGQGYFVPYDQQNSILKHEIVRDIIINSAAKYKICIADACFSGGINNSFAQNYTYQSISSFDDSKLAVLMSSNSAQTSSENQIISQGVFTYNLINGLKGNADYNKDSYVTIGELFTYTQRTVSLQTNGKQTPIIFGKDLYKIPMSRIKK